MRKNVEDRGDIIAVLARPDDAVAKARHLKKSIRARLASDAPQLLTNDERDLLLVAIAQALGILS